MSDVTRCRFRTIRAPRKKQPRMALSASRQRLGGFAGPLDNSQRTHEMTQAKRRIRARGPDKRSVEVSGRPAPEEFGTPVAAAEGVSGIILVPQWSSCVGHRSSSCCCRRAPKQRASQMVGPTPIRPMWQVPPTPPRLRRRLCRERPAGFGFRPLWRHRWTGCDLGHTNLRLYAAGRSRPRQHG